MNKLIIPVAVLLLAGTMLTAQDKKDDFKLEEGFTLLFNGKDLTGWTIMNNGKFEAKDGVLYLNKGSGWLRSDKEYKDFELRMDIRFMNKNADSGIFVRAGMEGKNWPSKAYQVQTMDNNSMGALFGSPGKSKRDSEAFKKAMKPTMEWMAYYITLKGDKLEVKLNGEVITTAEGLTEQGGFVGIQGEGGLLEFKHVRIKELK